MHENTHKHQWNTIHDNIRVKQHNPSPNKQKFTKPQKSENLGLKMHAMNENA